MKGICGANCDECDLLKNKKCEGCLKTKGCPFGKKCFIANYIQVGGKEEYNKFKKELINEFNNLKIDGKSEIKELYPLNGSFVNLEYSLPNNKKVKLLNDDEIYLGNQVECEFNDEETKKYFGLVGNMNFILVCEYEGNGNNPEIVIYKRR